MKESTLGAILESILLGLYVFVLVALGIIALTFITCAILFVVYICGQFGDFLGLWEA